MSERKKYQPNELPPVEVLIDDLFSFSFNQLRKQFRWSRKQMNDEYTYIEQKLIKEIPAYSKLDASGQKLVLSVRAMQLLYAHTPEPRNPATNWMVV